MSFTWRVVSTVKQLGLLERSCQVTSYQLMIQLEVPGSVAWCGNFVYRKGKNEMIGRNPEATSWVIVNVQDLCWVWLNCGDWKAQLFSCIEKTGGGSSRAGYMVWGHVWPNLQVGNFYHLPRQSLALKCLPCTAQYKYKVRFPSRAACWRLRTQASCKEVFSCS